MRGSVSRANVVLLEGRETLKYGIKKIDEAQNFHHQILISK